MVLEEYLIYFPAVFRIIVGKASKMRGEGSESGMRKRGNREGALHRRVNVIYTERCGTHC